jgi:hypothetical protein
VVHWIKALRPFLKGTLLMASQRAAEPPRRQADERRLWDMFTGSAPYREIFLRTLSPRFIGSLAWQTARGAVGAGRTKGG